MKHLPHERWLEQQRIAALRRGLLIELYPQVPASDLAALLDCSLNAIYKQAAALGVSKPITEVPVELLPGQRISRATGGFIQRLPGGVTRHVLR